MSDGPRILQKRLYTATASGTNGPRTVGIERATTAFSIWRWRRRKRCGVAEAPEPSAGTVGVV